MLNPENIAVTCEKVNRNRVKACLSDSSSVGPWAEARGCTGSENEHALHGESGPTGLSWISADPTS